MGFLKRATEPLAFQINLIRDLTGTGEFRWRAIMDTVLFMLKAITQEAAALASLSLFIAMIAIWTQVLGDW